MKSQKLSALMPDEWKTCVFHLNQQPMMECARLRYAYFVKQRCWVTENPATPGLEQDLFDHHALHIAVSDKEGIAAYLRLLPFTPEVGFMLDSDLSCVVSQEIRQSLPRANCAELSRLVVRPGAGDNATFPEHPHALQLLFKRFYQESKARGFERFYIVVEPGWLRLFARRFGLRFQVIGEPYVFLDGTRAVAATATLGEVEDGIQRFSPALFAWYQQQEQV